MGRNVDSEQIPDLRAIRVALELNVGEMAEALGVNRYTWSKWERGEQKPPAVAIRAMEMLQALKGTPQGQHFGV